MNKKYMRIIICILLYGFFFGGAMKPYNVQAVSASDNKLAIDETLEHFISETVSDTAVPIESSFVTDYIQFKSDQIIEINDKIDTEVYSFYVQEEKQIYSVISIIYPSEVRISKDDFITVTVNDYVWTYSPAEAVLYIKNKQEDEWIKKRDITAFVTGQNIEIYRGQIYNTDQYSRVILSFPALENVNSVEDTLLYCVHYTNFKYNSYMEWIIMIVLLFGALILFTYIKRKNRSNNSE